MKIEELHLSIEKQVGAEFDSNSEYTDVIVLLENGQKYIASFFTYDSIERLKLEHKASGAYLSGRYFRVDNMVLVEECSMERVREVVEDLIEEGEFLLVFRKISE